MKELFSALSQAAISRLNTPFLGSFILSYLIVNYKRITLFFISDSKAKIEMLNSSGEVFTWPSMESVFMHLVFPLGLALLYTFGLPLIQHLIDSLKFKYVDERRIDAQHSRQKSTFIKEGGISKIKAESSIDYWQSKLNRELDNWEERKQEYEGKLVTVNQELELSKREIESLKGTISEKMEIISEKDTVISEKDELVLNTQKQVSEIDRENKQNLQKWTELNTLNKESQKMLTSFYLLHHAASELIDMPILKLDEALKRSHVTLNINQLSELIDALTPRLKKEVAYSNQYINKLARDDRIVSSARAKTIERYKTDKEAVDTQDDAMARAYQQLDDGIGVALSQATNAPLDHKNGEA
ncbi:hypothetical protein C9980_12825 [Vibrio mediterranei]|uniref:hypothetical protein n=1 Tax=Vibrio mediterranei TaxID=689 RepID=UPI000D17F89D|nr:hypothetical protein [Vibrio mediterranei]PTC04335.1 hypothetical protein C9980_12825 [Vibrio mediterranei]